MAFPYPNENGNGPGDWNTYIAGVKERYERAGRLYPDPNDLNQYKWMSRAGYSSSQVAAESAFTKHWAELEHDLGLTPVPPEPPPTSGVMEPMKGYGRTHGSCLGDDSGPRHMFFVSYFASLKLFRDHRQEWEEQTDRLVGRCLGIRCMFFLVGAPWDGVSVPSQNTRDLTVRLDWPDYDTVFVAHGKRLKEKGLRIMLTSGAIVEMPDPPATYQRIANLCKLIDPTTVTSFFVLNEPWMTNTGGGEDWPRWRDLLSKFKAIFPWGIQGTAAPATQEDPAGLVESAKDPATVAELHGTRWAAPDAIRRAFNVKHEGYKEVRKPIVAAEETGPNLSGGAGAVYQPTNNADDLFAIYTMKILTGQGTVYLNGPGLWEQGPIDATWGVKELASLWDQMEIPNGVGNWVTTNLHQGPIGGTGYARIDGVHDDATGVCFKVASGDANGLIVARWSGLFTVYRASGVIVEKEVTAGQVVFSETGPNRPCVVRLIRK